MSLYYLIADDFSIEKGSLVTNLNGVTLVLFHHSRKCQHSIRYFPQFKQLPERIRGINFAACDVGENMSVVQMSKTSSTPITEVPKMMLYNNGFPYVEYTGKRENSDVMAFLNEIMAKINQKQVFMNQRQPQGGNHHHNNQGRDVTNHQQQHSIHQQQPPNRQTLPPPPSQQNRPNGNSGGAQGPPQANKYRIVPGTQVKEYEGSYGRPYNTASEADYIDELEAYRSAK
jgi:hypothetical protein